MAEHQVELVIRAKAELAEGPLWDYRRGYLYWVDIKSGHLHVYDPVADTDRAVPVGSQVGCVGLRRTGGLILGTQAGFAALELESGEVSLLIDPEHHLPANRFNDGKVDPQGRFWAGTMQDEGQPGKGSLYCLFPDLSLRTMISGVSISNGLAWTDDGSTMYYIDTPTHQVAAFDFDPQTGEIGGRRVAVRIGQDEGHPDGMTIDTEGMLWVALYAGGAVARYDPKTGKQLEKIEIPAPNVTCCCFAGLSMNDLYITTARQHMDKEQLKAAPGAGGIFRVRLPVGGRKEPMFAG